jgi:glucokinase
VEDCYVAVDLGATRVRVAYGNEAGLKEKLVEFTNTSQGPTGIAIQIIEMINKLNVKKIVAIGCGSAGPLNVKTGTLVNAHNFPFKRIPLVKPLSKAFSVSVTLLNDASTAVLGEQVFGAGRGMNNIVYITLSTGIGGGAIVDNHLLIGKDGNAVEIGHLTIDSSSSLICGCGCKGHWEAYCSGNNIPNYAKLLIREKATGDNILFELNDGEKLTTKTLFTIASKGDPLGLWIIRKMGEVNAVAFANVVNVFDPELITIGGSIAINNPDLVLKPINENIEKHLINRKPEIILTPLREDVVLYGALAIAMERVKKND